MTNEEAIKMIRDDMKLHHDSLSGEYRQALSKAIQALKRKPCEDSVAEWKQDFKEFINLLSMPRDDYNGIMNYIDELPSVTPKQKIGRWINAKVGKMFPSNDYKCSECGNILDFDGVNCGRGDANYCPNCGAKMEEKDNDES